MPTNAAKKALAKAKRGIVATGACSTKADPNFAALKDNKELPCPHCDRIFKQQDRLKQHIQKQHADVVAEQAVAAGPGDGAGGDGGGGKKISAKAALIQQQAAKAKEDKAREALEKGEKAPVQRMSCKLPSTILREFVQKKTDLKAPLFKSHEVDGGWTCKLVLRDKQGKTEKDRVFWWREKCATKQEAEHRVSVVALAAVAQNLPLQRLLPGEYRSTFADAEEAEKAKAENARVRAAREEARIARAKAANKAEPPAVLTMSEEKRGLVESILRETWVSDDDDDDDDVDDDVFSQETLQPTPTKPPPTKVAPPARARAQPAPPAKVAAPARSAPLHDIPVGTVVEARFGFSKQWYPARVDECTVAPNGQAKYTLEWLEEEGSFTPNVPATKVRLPVNG